MVDENSATPLEQYTEDAKKPKGSKILIFILVITVVLSAGGFIGYKTFVANKEKADSEIKKEKGDEKIVLVPLDAFIVNLGDTGRYLKVTMQLELVNPSYQEMVSQRIPNIRDAVITLLSSKSSDSVSGPEGKIQLKDDLLLRLNNAMGKEVFKNLYFTEFVMQ